jgi:acetyl esterase
MAANKDIEIKFDDRMSSESKSFVLSYLKSMRPKDLINADLNTIRENRNKMANIVNKSLKFENLSIKEFFVNNTDDEYKVPVSVYIPNDVIKDSPITIFIHGGGWTLNSRDTHFHSVASLATLTKTVWMSVEYRLCPEFQFPIPLNDCKHVVDWVLKNKKQFSSNNAKVGVSGDSGGGHFAALIAHELKRELNYQILIYPLVNFNISYNSYKEFTDEQYILVPEVIKFFFENLTQDKSILTTPKLSPIFNENFKELPMCLLLAAELDPLVDDSKEYFKKLRENGVDCELNIFKGTLHGFFHMPTLMKSSFDELKSVIHEYFKRKILS